MLGGGTTSPRKEAKMVPWWVALVSVLMGVGLSALFNGVGWLINNGVRKKRDAADIAKLLYDSIKGDAKVKEDVAIDKYLSIHKKLYKKLKEKIT